MNCMRQCEGPLNYVVLSPVTAKILEKILFAKKLDKNTKNKHENIIRANSSRRINNFLFLSDPCYKKFVKSLKSWNLLRYYKNRKKNLESMC